jgi:PAS domain S-box-containing protein
MRTQIYLNAHEWQFLESYRSGTDSVAQVLGRLRQLTTESSEQRERLDSLEVNITQWTEQNELRLSNPAAGAPPNTLQAQSLMQSLQRIAEMQNEEIASIEERRNEANSSTRLATLIIGILSIVVIGSCFVLLLVVQHGLMKRQVAQNIVRRQAERLRAILETHSDVAAADLSAGRLMNLIAKRMQSLTPAEILAIVPDEGDLVLSAGGGISTAQASGALKTLASIIERCARTGRSFRCDDAASDPRVDQEACKAARIQSVVSVPVKGAGHIFAVMTALSSRQGAFGDDTVDTMNHVARFLGDYLARTHEREGRMNTDQALRDTSRQLHTVTSERDQTRDLLQKANDELKQTNAERNSATEALHELEAELDAKVSERTHELEEIAQQSQSQQELTRALLENLSEAVIACDASGNIILCNQIARRWHGIENDRLPSREGLSQLYFSGGDVMTRIPPTGTPLMRALGGERVRGAELTIAARRQQPRYVLANGDPLLDAEGNTLGAVVVIHDTTERKRGEERMQEQESLLDISHDAIVVRNREHRILFWNKGAELMYGWSAIEAIGKKALDLHGKLTPAYEEARRIVIEKGEWSGEIQQVNKDGKEIIVESRWALERDARGEPKSILVIDTDITEKKKLEEQFLRAQRMESIGTLAGGIAHDLNNVLTPIMLSINVLRKKFPDEHSQKIIQLLDSSARRGAGMVKQVLTFARGMEGERGVLQPKHFVREMETIATETFPKSIKIRATVPKDLWTIVGDSTQIHQVLLNLCVNARDAMPSGGELTLTAENTMLEESSRIHPDAKAGPYVKLSATDTGTGIPPEVMDKIFDPFFTTKEQGKGTGLGLSTVIGIVQGHEGFLLVDSEVGKGTTFNVYFPATEASVTQQASKAMSEIPHAHGEGILVIDDELTIREITKATLETFGYRVVTAMDGKEALALFAETKNDIKIVVCDMMMPTMDGPATIRALQEIRPDIRIVAVTGLMDEQKSTFAEGSGSVTLLQKPYSTEKLLMMLQETLSAQPNP